MTSKRPILTNLIRRVPSQFSWIDHKLVRDRHIERLTHQGAALYLLLVAVGDADGLSWYGDESIMTRLSMDKGALLEARLNLIQNGMIAWREPIYQVLSLERSEDK
jgi:hypothetical protein